MGIKEIKVYAVTLAYKEPFRISPSISTETHNIVVRVLTDYDVVGWGESSPSKRVTGESTETVLESLDQICPKLIGTCPLRIEKQVSLMDEIVEGNPAAKASIDIALHDLLGKTVRKPLFMILGGYRCEVLTDLTLGIKNPNEMAKDAVRAIRKGFKALKVKVGVNPDEDVERVREVREAVGGPVQIRIDANQGWTVPQAIDTLGRMQEFDVQFVEQPVDFRDIEGLRHVRKSSPIRIMADESVHSPQQALHLILKDAVDYINIKLMKSGGLLKARKTAEVADSAGIACMIGCMGESSLGIAAATHLAAGVKNIQFADLDSDLLLRENIVENPLRVRNSMRHLGKEDGLGVKVIEEKLGKACRTYK